MALFFAFDEDGCPGRHAIEQPYHVIIAHANTTDRCGRAQQIGVRRSMDVDVAVVRITTRAAVATGFQSAQPENSRRNDVVAGSWGLRTNLPADEDRSARRARTDLLFHAMHPQGRAMAAVADSPRRISTSKPETATRCRSRRPSAAAARRHRHEQRRGAYLPATTRSDFQRGKSVVINRCQRLRALLRRPVHAPGRCAAIPAAVNRRDLHRR